MMRFLGILIKLLLLLALAGCAGLAAMYIYVKDDLPSVSVLKDVELQIPMRIYSADGLLISQYGVKKRIPLQLEEVPLKLKQALLATEDSRFYQHPGIDPIGLMRAVVNLIATGEKGQGGSTLTMQIARKFFLTAEKRYIRKIREIFIALHIEQLLSKDEIITLYLNKMELGHRAFGVGAAAQVYYGKPIHDLTLAQIATLTGVYKAPSVLNPISNPEKSKQRRRVVLGRMLAEKYITRAQFEESANAPVTASRHGAKIELDAPYLADMIYREMVDMYGKEVAETQGFSIYSTVPSTLQKHAQYALRQNLHDYDERHGYRGPIEQLWGQNLAIYLTEKEQETEQNESELESDITDESAVVAWTTDEITQYLKRQKEYSPLELAVVLDVTDTSINVQTKDNRVVTIGWKGLMWARHFIDDSQQGNIPTTAHDIVNSGALIWIRRNEDIQGYQLSQFPQASSAFVALNPNTGAIQAVVGGYSFQQSQFNRATQAKRQIGSNIKPFIYSAALKHGYSLASIINDAPINQWQKSSGIAWRPKNSPDVYEGPIRLRTALGKSKNVVSVRLLRGIGIDNTIDYLGNFGFEKDTLPRDESLSLGSASTTPLQVARGFATIENGGFLISPYVIARVENGNGDLLWKNNPEIACLQCLQDNNSDDDQPQDIDFLFDDGTDENLTLNGKSDVDNDVLDEFDNADVNVAIQTISESNAFLVKQMLKTAITGDGSWTHKTAWNGTGWRANNILKRKDLAGKTGTTNDAKDTWFSGMAGNLVATTWVGFDNNERSLGRTSSHQQLINQNPKRYNWMGNAMVGAEDGARVAQPAWIRFMQKALVDTPAVLKPVPEGIVTVRIDRASGKLTSRTDYTSRFEYFSDGTEPKNYITGKETSNPFSDNTDQTPEAEESIF